MRRAEMELWSTTANIGEAKANLYPNIKLTGSYGLASTDLSKFFDPGSQTWNIFASLLQPIFAGGALRAQVEVRESQQRQALYAYEKTLLGALREVEDSLVGLDKTGKERDERASGRRAHGDRLSELRYKGASPATSGTRRATLALRRPDRRSNSVSEAARALILLYKALGGGWPIPGGTKPISRRLRGRAPAESRFRCVS
jgi:outer membrane protein TolC